MKLIPQTTAPNLEVKTTTGKVWKLADQNPENFTMVTFYRGLHCPVCKSYVQTMQKMKEDWAKIGVTMVAISMDTEKRANIAATDWKIDEVSIGYELTKEQADEWGLYLSKGVKDKEPDLFSEPGLFLIKPNQEVYYVAINSQPFGRPHLPSFVKSVEWIIGNDYPARGEATI